MKTSVLWDITHCSCWVTRRSGGTWCLHLYGRRISQERNQREAGSKSRAIRLRKDRVYKASSRACYLLQAGFLLDLFFDHEDGGDMFLRNVGWLSMDYTALYPRRYNSSYRLHFSVKVIFIFLRETLLRINYYILVLENNVWNLTLNNSGDKNFSWEADSRSANPKFLTFYGH
jgi:hypothetical protein